MAVFVAISQWPLLFKFFQDLLTRPQYEFFPLVLAGAVWLGWERLRERVIPAPTPMDRCLAVGWFLLALLLSTAGALFFIRLLAPAAAVVSIAGGVFWTGGRRLALRMLPAGILLLTVIPPPRFIDSAFNEALRGWAVHSSSRVLDSIGIVHRVAGTVIELPTRRLLVEEACSGINSVMTISAFSLLLGFRNRRPIWAIPLLLGSAVTIVVWVNTVRIVGAAWAGETLHIDLFAHAVHGWFGWLLFVVSLALVYSADRFLGFVVGERSGTAVETAQPTHPGRAFLPLPLAIGLSVVALAVGAFSQYRLVDAWPSAKLAAGAVFSLPNQLAGWDRTGVDGEVTIRPQLLAAESHAWMLSRSASSPSGSPPASSPPVSPMQAVLAIDYTFPGYHELTTCYRAGGWTIEPETSGLAEQRDSAFREVPMHQSFGGTGCLWFAIVDEAGNWLSPEGREPNPGGLGGMLQEARRVATSPPAYQIQLLVQREANQSPMTDVDRSAARQLFLRAREILRQQLRSQVGGKP